MDKFFIQLSDAEQYSDNRLGRLISNFLIECHEDLILYFREHIILVEYNKDSRDYTLRICKDLSPQFKEESVVLVEHLKTFNVECHKWVPYYFMKELRALYPELANVDFPVDEYRMWFTDIDSWVYAKDISFIEVENGDWDYIYEDDEGD